MKTIKFTVTETFTKTFEIKVCNDSTALEWDDIIESKCNSGKLDATKNCDDFSREISYIDD